MVAVAQTGVIEELMLELVDGRGVAMKLRAYEHGRNADCSIAAFQFEASPE
jgi:hypothetical protein